jgi:hypothetical protein
MDLTKRFIGLNFDGQYFDISGSGSPGHNPLSTDSTVDGFLSSRWRP